MDFLWNEDDFNPKVSNSVYKQKILQSTKPQNLVYRNLVLLFTVILQSIRFLDSNMSDVERCQDNSITHSNEDEIPVYENDDFCYKK